MQNHKTNPSSGQSKKSIQKDLINANLTNIRLKNEVKNHQLYNKEQKGKELDLYDKSYSNLKTIREALYFTSINLSENNNKSDQYTASVLNLVIEKIEAQELLNENYFKGKFGGKK